MGESQVYMEALDEACQHLNDLLFYQALLEGKMSETVLTEAFSSKDFLNLVRHVAAAAKVLPPEMEATQAALQKAVKLGKQAKIFVNRGQLSKEKFARVVAKIASIASAVGSVTQEIRNVSALKDAMQGIAPDGQDMQEDEETDVLLNEEGEETLDSWLTDKDDRRLVRSSIEQYFKPRWGMASLFGWNDLFGLTPDVLFKDLMKVKMSSLPRLMNGKVPHHLTQTMSNDDAQEIIDQSDVSEEEPGQDPSAEDEGSVVSRDDVADLMRAITSKKGPLTTDDRLEIRKHIVNFVEKQGLKVEQDEKEGQIILERWRRMAGIGGNS